MKCISRGNGLLWLDNGETIKFLKWINAVQGKQYFSADHRGKERIYHVLERDGNGKITEIEKVR